MFAPLSLPQRCAVMPLAAIAGGAAIQSPFVSLKDVFAIDILIRIESGAPEPVLALQQADDAAGTNARTLQLDTVEIAAAADVEASQPWAKVDGVDRANAVDTYTPAGAYVTTGNEALIAIRIHADVLDDTATHVRLNMAAVAGRNCVVYIEGQKERTGRYDAALIA